MFGVALVAAVYSIHLCLTSSGLQTTWTTSVQVNIGPFPVYRLHGHLYICTVKHGFIPVSRLCGQHLYR